MIQLYYVTEKIEDQDIDVKEITTRNSQEYVKKLLRNLIKQGADWDLSFYDATKSEKNKFLSLVNYGEVFELIYQGRVNKVCAQLPRRMLDSTKECLADIFAEIAEIYEASPIGTRHITTLVLKE